MTHGSLFSGIGGFDLAAQWMSWENVFHCEIDPFCQQVLQFYWPKSTSYADIKKTDFTIHAGRVDVLTGGFPCQPYSLAGQRRGTEDERHLWPEMLRAIAEVQPGWIVGENVPGIVSWNDGMVFEQVCADLEREGYTVWPVILPAAGINAPHARHRVFFIAHANGIGVESRRREDRAGIQEKETGIGAGLRGEADRPGEKWPAAATTGKRLQIGGTTGEQITTICGRERIFGSNGNAENWEKWPTQSPIFGRNDGVSGRLDTKAISKKAWRRQSLKAYGNAIVPQLAYRLFKIIEEMQNSNF